jgi:hypothetical protein
MKCLICLNNKASKKHCCVKTHVKCQKQWGDTCIICKKKIPGLKTNKKYVYREEELPEITIELTEDVEDYINMQENIVQYFIRECINRVEIASSNTIRQLWIDILRDIGININ